jgi:hypothetical protein
VPTVLRWHLPPLCGHDASTAASTMSLSKPL